MLRKTCQVVAPAYKMIQTTVAEINVEELMTRIQTRAAEIRRKEERAARGDSRPALSQLREPASIPPLPPVALPQPVKTTKARISPIVERLERTLQPRRWLPRPLRSLFRKQGSYNHALLQAIRLLTRANGELTHRIQQLTACVEVQQAALHELQKHGEATTDWQRAARQTFGSFNADLARATSEFQEELDSTRRELHSQRQEDERQDDDLVELQRQIDAHAETTRRLQSHVDELWNGFSALRGDGEARTEHLSNLQRQADAATEAARALQSNIGATATQLGDLWNGFRELRSDGERVTRHLATHDAALTQLSELRSDGERVGEHLRNLQGQLDPLRRAYEDLEERLTNDATFLKAELSQQRALLQHLLVPAPPRTQKAQTETGGNENASPNKNAALDSFYLSFENRFRGKRSEIKKRLRFYLPLIENAKAGSADAPVLDLGCGRGEWLELLKERQLEARGVDLNAAMVAQCDGRGLEVEQFDAVEYLRKLEPGSKGAVTGFHIIEHLPFEVLMELLAQTHRALRPGGIAIFESPNCKNLVVGACNFNLDPTHRNPVHPETAEFMLSLAGFADVRVEYLSPAEGSPFDDRGSASTYLHERLFGPQDFAVIGLKPTKR